MGSVSHIDDEKKELVKEVHQLARLGVRLVDTPSGGVSVHSSSESSFVVDVKAKQHLDPVLMELKDSVLSKLGGIVYLDRWADCVCPILIIYDLILLESLVAPGIPFIHVPPRCMMISTRFIPFISLWRSPN